MPAMYAHYRYGEEVLDLLDTDLQAIIKLYKHEFIVGLQGPDFLFFQRPLIKTKVNKLGMDIHFKSAKDFIYKNQHVLEKYGRYSPQYAYMLGFLLHFSLDSECHPFIDTVGPMINVPHLVIESEYEKFLLKKDHRDPNTFVYGNLLPLSKDVVDAIAPFYGELKRSDIKEALYSMKAFKRILFTPTKRKQRVIKRLLRLTGQYDYLRGQLIDYDNEAKCRVTTFGIYNRYILARPVGVYVLTTFDKYMKNEGVLSERFNRTFELEEE